jgi:hypothetical protein
MSRLPPVRPNEDSRPGIANIPPVVLPGTERAMEDGPKNPWKLAGALTAVFCFMLVGGLAFIVMSFQPQPIKPVTGFAKFTT